MRITCYFIGFNIQETIGFTIKHYQQFCQRIVYYDNFSDDLSRDIAQELGAEVHLFGRAGVLDDQAYVDIKNHVWKGDDSDYVIVCDDDEILLHPPHGTGATIFKTQGYGMVSNDFPRETWTEIMTGVSDEQYSKLVIFNPKQIKEIGYVYGCHGHQTKPKGNLFWGPSIPLLHYNRVGGVERLIKRQRMYNQKQRGEANIKWNLGHHYLQEEKEKRRYFSEQLERAETLSFPTGV